MDEEEKKKYIEKMMAGARVNEKYMKILFDAENKKLRFSRNEADGGFSAFATTGLLPQNAITTVRIRLIQ